MYMQYYAYNCVYAYRMYDCLYYTPTTYNINHTLHIFAYLYTYVYVGVHDNAYNLWRGQERPVRIVSNE